MADVENALPWLEDAWLGAGAGGAGGGESIYSFACLMDRESD